MSEETPTNPCDVATIPEAEWNRFLEAAMNAQLAAEAGYVGIAGCLLEAARRRAERAEAERAVGTNAPA